MQCGMSERHTDHGLILGIWLLGHPIYQSVRRHVQQRFYTLIQTQQTNPRSPRPHPPK